MLSSKGLKEIVTAARPIIERQLDDAEQIAAFRDKVADAGGDWSALKALIKAQIQDERDESGQGKRVKKILDKAGFSTDYAELLGWSNMNEKNFSAGEERIDPLTGEFIDDNVDPKLAHTIVTGLQTETGRAALIAAVDIMIAREEAEEETHQRPSTNDEPSPEAGPQAEASPAGTGAGTLADREGRHDASDQPLTGGDNVESSGLPAGLEGGPVNLEPSGPEAERATSLTTKTPSPLRPHCRNPGETCGGSGSKHCHSCTKAMREQEEFA